MPIHDDKRRVGRTDRQVTSGDACVLERRVLERLEPARQHADPLILDRGLDALEALDGPKAFAVVARTFGGPAALAFVDTVEATRDFVGRFLALGRPTIWHAGEIVGVTILGLDLDDPETVAKTADQPRGRWLIAPAGDALVDPRERPPLEATRRDRKPRR